MLREEFNNLLEQYRTVLDALAFQNTVAGRLEAITSDKVSSAALCLDAATQTDFEDRESDVMQLLHLKIKIARCARRRAVFEVESAREVLTHAGIVETLRTEAASDTSVVNAILHRVKP